MARPSRRHLALFSEYRPWSLVTGFSSMVATPFFQSFEHFLLSTSRLQLWWTFGNSSHVTRTNSRSCEHRGLERKKYPKHMGRCQRIIWHYLIGRLRNGCNSLPIDKQHLL